MDPKPLIMDEQNVRMLQALCAIARLTDEEWEQLKTQELVTRRESEGFTPSEVGEHG